MRELLNRRQRAAGQPDIVPYIPTMSPPRTAFTGLISANRQLVFGEMSFARVRAISKKAACGQHPASAWRPDQHHAAEPRRLALLRSYRGTREDG
jgi:hypothetical protein